MIAVLKPGAKNAQIQALLTWLKEQGMAATLLHGENCLLLALLGDTSHFDPGLLERMEIVDTVKRISEPYQAVSRNKHPVDTSVRLGDVCLGGGAFQLIAGPCTVESAEQVLSIAKAVQRAGATIFRGGAFKPRTSPYDFQGLGKEGLEMLGEVKRETNMPVVSEIMGIHHLPLFEHIDVIQVGARNMQNFELLRALGRLQKPVLLKRGMANTLDELLMSAEYIVSAGNGQVILCERGIRTFAPETRNTLDLSAVPLLQQKTHLPVIVDPSHATGMAQLVAPMALAAVAAGADGLMLEVHGQPACALCDGSQAILPQTFAEIAEKAFQIRAIVRQSKD